jgi:hypothetical protein
MNNHIRNVLNTQIDYYESLFSKYGYSPQSVGSENPVKKNIRYEQLSHMFHGDNNFSVHDVGHGLGHYYQYLRETFPEKNISYSGSEVCPQFTSFCKEHYPECSFYLRNLAENPLSEKYDYIVFGGTFYHIENILEEDWKCFIELMIKNAYISSTKAVSFNFITDYCDYYKPGLFYCKIDYITDFIVKNLTRFFIIHHAYPLYEYTITIYHPDIVKEQYPEQEFRRYFKE